MRQKPGAAQAEKFLEKLLMEEGGVYTLFGSKPLTDVLIFKGTASDISLDGLSEHSLREIAYVDDQTFECFEAWKQFSKGLKFHKFRFFERPSPYDPLHVSYYLFNIEKAREVYEEYKALFTEKVGRTLSFDEALDELENPHSTFWEIVLADHELSGLLYGYGKENAASFARGLGSEVQFSETRKRNAKTSFPLPIYAVSKEDRITKKYREEQKKIQEIYRNRPFFEVTLKRITE